MSKAATLRFAELAAFACVLFAAVPATAQHSRRVQIEFVAPASVRVSGSVQPTRHLFFLNSRAGFDGLEARISDVRLADADARPVAHKAFVPGHVVADSDFTSFSYSADLRPGKDRRRAAHTSWISGDTGILFLADLIAGTDSPGTLDVTITLPAGWNGPERPLRLTRYETVVIPIGTGWRRPARETPLDLTISGKWLFTDDEASASAAEIYRDLHDLFDSDPAERANIVISRFSDAAPPGTWEAETLGNTVLILSGDMMFQTQSVQRLDEQLRHEMFHLWIPNDLNLNGSYDWFFEGFASYRSLRSAVVRGRIRFDDMLDTLSRAYSIDHTMPNRMSLIETSKTRWAGGETYLYARGMLAAFLMEIEMLSASGGKRSIDDLLKGFYAAHRPPAPTVDGTDAALAAFGRYPEVAGVVEDIVKGPGRVEWAEIVKLAGLEVAGAGALERLVVARKPAGREKRVLDKLGYNSWKGSASVRK